MVAYLYSNKLIFGEFTVQRYNKILCFQTEMLRFFKQEYQQRKLT